MQSHLLWIEPPVATCIDTRTGCLANRKRCAYPRVGPTLAALLARGGTRRLIRELAPPHGLLPGIVYAPGLECSVEVLDCVASAYTQEVCFELESPGYRGSVRWYDGLRYGLSGRRLFEELRRRRRPDLVAVPASFTALKGEALNVCRTARAVWPEVPVVIGGQLASSDCAAFLASGDVTAVCLGEAWLTFPEVVARIVGDHGLSDVPGIAFVAGDGTFHDTRLTTGVLPRLKNLDVLPYCRWDLVPFDPYDAVGLDHMERFALDDLIAPVDSEVGCGLKPACRFCSAGLYNDGFVATKSAARVIREIEILAERYDRNFIYLDNDNPMVGYERMNEVCRWLCEYNDSRRARGLRDVRFAFSNGTSSWSVHDQESLELAIQAGLVHVALGLETASPPQVELVGKPVRNPQLVARAIRLLRDAESAVRRHRLDLPTLGIELFTVVGLPGETERDLQITESFCRELVIKHEAVVSPFVFSPIHGSSLREVFFEENPEARKLPDVVLGLMGTCKKDSLSANALTETYQRRFKALAYEDSACALRRF